MVKFRYQIVFRVLPHILFWGFFVLLFGLQNPTADSNDYFALFVILGVSALVVYVNLYWLVPQVFFRKKHIAYSIFVVLNIGLGALTLWFLIPSGNGSYVISFFQHFVNLAFLVVITSSFKIYRAYLHKKELLIITENEQLKTEISLLKSQVNSHFLFNTLNNLYGLIVKGQNKRASEVTLRLSDLMRYLLENSKSDSVILNKEIKFIKDYLDLEKIRLNEDVDIKMEINVIDNEVLIAPLLFIPLMENAFKHGLLTISKKNFAHFSLYAQGSDVFFEARNSVGENLDKNVRSGTGLANLRKRLQLIYPQAHQLEIEQTESTFKVTLHLQL